MRWLPILLACAWPAVAHETVSGAEGDCGFSEFHPLRSSHFIDGGALTKVKPQYPLAAKTDGVVGKVRVRVMVNSKGLVERTCPEFVKGAPRPDRTLVIAAEAAALQWIFPANFGLVSGSSAKFSHVQGVLIFDFVLDGSKKDDLESPHGR